MKVIKPATVTSALVVSTTATETNSAWSSATSYALNDLVILTSTNRIYKCIQVPCVNKDPATQYLYWQDVGPTNTWAMFDTEVSTQTTKAGDLTVVVKPGYVNSIALFNIVGNTLDITMRDSLAGAVVYTKSLLLEASLYTIGDWYMYFFEPFDTLEQIVITDLPAYLDGHITLTVGGALVNKVGIVIFGTYYELGGTLQGVTSGIVDYSRKDTNLTTGATTFLKRSFSKRMSAKLLVDKARLNGVHKVLADVRATPCAWIATDGAGYELLTFFGFYRDFSIDVAYPSHFYTTLEIEGLI